MLTIPETRRLLGDATMPDEQVEEIRDSLRILAEIIFEQWMTGKVKEPITHPQQPAHNPKIYGEV